MVLREAFQGLDQHVAQSGDCGTHNVCTSFTSCVAINYDSVTTILFFYLYFNQSCVTLLYLRSVAHPVADYWITALSLLNAYPIMSFKKKTALLVFPVDTPSYINLIYPPSRVCYSNSLTFSNIIVCPSDIQMIKSCFSIFLLLFC